MALCRRHGLCRVGDMSPTCWRVCHFGGKNSPTRHRHYQPRLAWGASGAYVSEIRATNATSKKVVDFRNLSRSVSDAGYVIPDVDAPTFLYNDNEACVRVVTQHDFQSGPSHRILQKLRSQMGPRWDN